MKADQTNFQSNIGLKHWLKNNRRNRMARKTRKPAGKPSGRRRPMGGKKSGRRR
jgi:hypothetical protein